MGLVVDTFVLGPARENCHVVRTGTDATEAVVVDPGDDAAQLRVELAQLGAGCADLPGGSWDTLVGSIRRLMDTLPPDTVVYPGHGPQTTLGAELARNPFLEELRAS